MRPYQFPVVSNLLWLNFGIWIKSGCSGFLREGEGQKRYLKLAALLPNSIEEARAGLPRGPRSSDDVSDKERLFCADQIAIGEFLRAIG
jgi:hypothetical protein